ncbi:MAG: hypothetical protein J1F35_08380 [Erysipelotrichales bacterium]|nr:hypothetical protein [Erysipelotrichales bacterium]
MSFNRINIRTDLNIWETLEDIDIDLIKEYIELKENENKECLKEFKKLDFETYVDIDTDDALNEMWDSDIKREAENRGFIICEDEFDDIDEDELEDLALAVSKLSHFDTDRFFKEFMKNKRIYNKEELIEFIGNI